MSGTGHGAERDVAMLPAIETVETVLGIRNESGALEPIINGRQYDTRITPIVQLRRTVLWAESVAGEWEVVPRVIPPHEAPR